MILKFDSTNESKMRFEYILHGMYITGNRIQQKGLAVLKREIKILDKLEMISKPCDCGKKIPGTDEIDRELNSIVPEAGPLLTLDIDANELDMVINYIGNVPWSFGKSSRNALATIEWLKEHDR